MGMRACPSQATLATFPLLRAKIMAMSDDSNRPKESKGLGVIGCLGFMYRREDGGIIGMYQGVWAEMSRELEQPSALTLVYTVLPGA